MGRADLTDADIVLGEGRQIVFVDPARIDELDLAETTADFLPRFLASETYRRLTRLTAVSAGRCPSGSRGRRS